MALLGVVVRVRAQYAEPGAGDGGQGVVLAQLVLAVAEEREVVVGEPAQQLAGLLDLRSGQIAGDGLVRQPLRQPDRRLPHLVPVLDGLTGVGQHAQQVGGDLLQIGPVRLAVGLHVDPGLDVRVVREVTHAGRRRGQHLDELAGHIAPHHELRVDDDVDPAPLPRQLIGDGVDEEGHVVGDDLDDGVAARPPVLFHGGGVNPHVGRALGAVLGQPVVGHGGSEDIDRVAVGKVLRGRVQVVTLEERDQGLAVRGFLGVWGLLARRPGR